MAGKKSIPMRTVKKRTGLTSRQIRYYDQNDLIFPDRTKGNQRLFSEEDIKRLKRIKSLLAEGLTLEVVKKKLNQPKSLKDESIKNNSIKIKTDQLKNRLNKGQLSSLYPVSKKTQFKEKVKRNKE
ncbi:MAG: MerR family transcriptional regulator [Halothermotrichaceae bacterium]